MSRYFFRNLIGEWKTKLQIPRLLVSSFSLTPKKVILINASSKNLWEVYMDKEEEEDSTELYFKKGWSKFVKDNALVAADFLIFKFDGNSTFKVAICGESTCEKILESQAGARMNPKNHKDLILVEIKEKLDSGTSSHAMLDEEMLDEEEDEEKEQEEEQESDKFSDINSEPYDSTMNIGEGSSLATCPSFRIQLKPTAIKEGCTVQCIPTDFFRKYLGKEKQEVEMETEKGVWKVTSLPHLKRGRMFARFSRGWAEFVRRNQFQVGETLLFTMIGGYRPKFIVRKE